MSVVADSGAVFALIDRRDEFHRSVVAWWEAASDVVVLPVTTLPEISYLLHVRLGVHAEIEFARQVVAGEFTVEPVESEDLERAADLMTVYRDLKLGLVDATVIAVAERLGAPQVLTTDRRHFGVVRPRHMERLRLVP